MSYRETPSDDQVVAALERLGGRATSLQLCDQLVFDGHTRRDSQLAIQRAAERRCVIRNDDFSLRLPPREEAVVGQQEVVAA